MKHIILIEDDLAIIDSLSIFFETVGIRMTAYESGDKILAEDYEYPDLFLIDKQLSGMNGLDVCRYLKSGERTREIPVIMISASSDIIDLSKTAGADEVILKPYELSDVLTIISKYV